jgi:peroxiredoxin
MANPLTGNYDAIVQIALRQINGLLAALHQNGADEAAELKLLHNAHLRIPPQKRRRPGADALTEWVLEYQHAGVARGFPQLKNALVSHAPAGAARTLADALGSLDELPPVEDAPDALKGHVQLQLSTLRISIPGESSSRVTVHAHIRARYFPLPDTSDLPAPIHGEVRAVFEVRTSTVLGRRRLVVRPSADDADITFSAAAGTGLTAADVGRLSSQVRKVIRDGFEILPVDVPAGFPFSEFKGVGSGSHAALALPISLSGGGLPPNAIHSITSSFLGSSGFGFAVSREHVTSLIDVEKIRESVRQQTIPIRIWTPFGSVTVTYRMRFSSGPTLTFSSGAIAISGRIDVTHPTFPDGWVSFKQLVRLRLDASNRVRLERLGDPEVNDSLLVPHGTAVQAVRREMNSALRANRPAVRRVFADALENLSEGLRLADDAGGALYTSVEITPDGIIARGDMVGSGRVAPVIAIGEALQGQAFTAFNSWIPAGDITRFVWSWIEYSSKTAWSGVMRTAIDDHTFILPKPAGLSSVSQICLRLEGTQTVPSGLSPLVTGGQLCQVSRPDLIMDTPSWFAPVTVPIWLPDVAPDEVMRDAIAAHVSVQSDRPPGNGPGANTLVHFADLSDPTSLTIISKALSQLPPRYAAVSLMVVVARGTLDQRRRDIDAKLSIHLGAVQQLVYLTEDDEGGWTKTFDPKTIPATFLIDARRRLVWTSSGPATAESLAAALEAHVIPAPPRQRTPLTLAVAVGERVPDAAFTDEREQPYALHRLRRRRLLLNFWQSWSAPSLAELRRLQAISQAGDRAPFVVAFHGGNDAHAPDIVRRQLGLTFPLVQDGEQRIGRKYGVSCWPTTVSVDADGRVEHIQFGRMREGKRG